MNKIAQFVDNMFAALPNTDEMQTAKAKITEMMEDKFDALIAEGKNENEALGILVSEFGNVSELLADIEAQQVSSAEESVNYTQTYYTDPAFFEEYDEFQKKFPIAMVAGVLICIMAVISVIFFGSLMDNSVLPVIIFFIIISGAVALFIYFGMQKERYEKLRKEYELEKANIDVQKYYSRKKLAENVSGIIMLAATAIFFAGGGLFNRWHPGWIVFPIGGILCGIVSTALGVEDD